MCCSMLRMPKALGRDSCSGPADQNQVLSFAGYHAAACLPGLECLPEEQCLAGMVQLSSSLGHEHAAPELAAGLSNWTCWDA